MGTNVILGQRGAALIKGKETLRLVAYKPTPNDKWTIGWGHTAGVHEGDSITAEQADALFIFDTAEAVSAVNRLGFGVKLSQSMFDALVCLAFNAGAAVAPGNDIWTALRRADEPDYFDAWRGIAAYTKQRGEDLRGLALRRAAEMALFFEDRLP